MLQRILKFVKYNNLFAISFMVLFGGLSVSFAASPELRSSVYESHDKVTSVDNSRIISADLDHFDFSLRINSVKEDDAYYYVDYTYKTMTIKNYSWQDTDVTKTLKVSKVSLGDKDLGLYVAAELGDNINYELSYLKDVQKLQKDKGKSPTVITTEYSGLIGKMLDPKEKVIEGYTPVIPVPVPEPNAPEYIPPTPDPEPIPTPPTLITSGKEFDEEVIRRIIAQMLADQHNPPPPPTPTDVCPNMDGTQGSIPSGYHLDGSNCVADEPTPTPDPVPTPDPTPTPPPPEPTPEPTPAP